MRSRKRSVTDDTIDNSIKKQPRTGWRRFMNERAVRRAYVPTSYGKMSSHTILILIFIL